VNYEVEVNTNTACKAMSLLAHHFSDNMLLQAFPHVHSPRCARHSRWYGSVCSNRVRNMSTFKTTS